MDLVLKGDQLILTMQFQIENQLDHLMLPYKIDLSIWHFIGNPELIDHIQRAGKVFFSRNPANSID